MRSSINHAAIAAGLLAFPASAFAQSGETVATAQKPSLETQLNAQAAQIEQQNLKIKELESRLEELSGIMSTRVDRVEAQTENGRANLSTPSTRLEGPNARNSLAFVGAVQVTADAVIDQKRNSASTPAIRAGTEIRRARIGLQGVAYSDFAYAAEVDLATNGTLTAAAKDLWVAYNGFRPFSFTIGNMKPQTGLEASFSDRSNAQTFIEGSMLTSMITATGARNVGIRAATGGSNWSATVGYYGDDVNNNGVASPGVEGDGVHWRVTYAPVMTRTALLHLGASGYYRDVSTDNTAASQLRLRAQPENTLDATRLIDTGNLSFADTARLTALEAAGYIGPIGLQSEYAELAITEKAGRPDLNFSGAYVGVNWFVTGEKRVYDPRTGVFTRFAPRASFSPADGTWGAWELAARWSTLNLNDKVGVGTGATLIGVRGGEETNWTGGVNWYWNPYFRLMLNYVAADVKNRTNTFPGVGADEGASLDTVSLRVQQEW
jgi:phosphate-selective porin OprO/OprP